MTANSIADIALFADLDPPLRSNIEERCTWVAFDPGQEIVGYLTEDRDIYFLLDGTVRATRYSAQGKEVGFRDMGAGETFGLLAALDGGQRSASIIANTSCRMAVMTEAAFRDILQRNPDIASVVTLYLVALVRDLSDRVFEAATLPVRHRVEAELLRLGRSHAVDGANSASLTPSPTNAEIAARVQARREAVSRVMHKLEGEGVIERRHRTLHIVDLQRLETRLADLLGTAI